MTRRNRIDPDPRALPVDSFDERQAPMPDVDQKEALWDRIHRAFLYHQDRPTTTYQIAAIAGAGEVAVLEELRRQQAALLVDEVDQGVWRLV